MDEEEAKQRTKEWLEKEGYKVHQEVSICENREVILDFYAYKDSPFILWVEVKGDVSLSQLLEGFIRVELATYLGGGQGLLAVPHKATQRLLQHRRFLSQAEKVIAILDVEREQTHHLSS